MTLARGFKSHAPHFPGPEFASKINGALVPKGSREHSASKIRLPHPSLENPASARLGVRVSAAALERLGEHPAVRAREVIEEWANWRMLS